MPYTNKSVPYARGSATSRAAAESITPGSIRLRVFDAIATAKAGLTCEEVEQLLGLRHQTASARIRELAKAEAIIPFGRRLTTSRREAIVWRKA